MKIHADLKRLLLDFGLKASKYTNNIRDKRDPEQFVDDYLSSNSLALGKPEPLAKNKQTENKLFDCPSQENGICDCTDECTWDFDEIT